MQTSGLRAACCGVGADIMTMRRFALLAAVALTASACVTFGRQSIAELQHNPGRYHNRSVHIDGVVTSSWGGPLVPFRMYKVDDGTGEVTVLSQGSRTPTKGARVRVKGRVNEVAVLGGQAVGLHLREEHLRVERR
jgi:hypothetical protein